MCEHNSVLHSNSGLTPVFCDLIDGSHAKNASFVQLHQSLEHYHTASFSSQQIVRRPTNNQLSLFHLSSSDPIALVRPHQWQDQTAVLITTVRMKEAGLMSSDRGMYTRDLDKKEASIIAPRLPIS